MNLSNLWVRKKTLGSFYDSKSYEYIEECAHFPVSSLLKILDEQLLCHVSSCGGYILDVGCGVGRNLVPSSEEKSMIGVDIAGNLLRIAKEKISDERNAIQLIKADAEVLPLKENVCSCAFSNYGALNHLPSPKKAIVEMARVTEHEGIVLLWVINRFDLVSIISFVIRRKWRAARNQLRGEDIRNWNERFIWYGNLLDVARVKKYFADANLRIETIKAIPLFLHLFFQLDERTYSKLPRCLRLIDLRLGSHNLFNGLGMGIFIKARKLKR